MPASSPGRGNGRMGRRGPESSAGISLMSGIVNYFGRGYYELYRHWLLPEAQTRAEVRFLLSRLRPRRGQRWLDLPCGYGRHLSSLRALCPGLRLFGGDLNRDYLHEPGLARAAAVAQCDMRRLPFADGS